MLCAVAQGACRLKQRAVCKYLFYIFYFPISQPYLKKGFANIVRDIYLW